MLLQEQLKLSAPWREQLSVLSSRTLTLYSLHWSSAFIEISTLMLSTQTKIQKNNFGFTHASSKFHFCSTEGQTLFLLVNFNSWWQHQMSVCKLKHDRPSGWFSKSWGFFCLQEFPSFHLHPLPALLLLPFFVRSLIYSSSSFFAPKPHGNACYGGYLVCHVTKY